jgi:hypothetical protein
MTAPELNGGIRSTYPGSGTGCPGSLAAGCATTCRTRAGAHRTTRSEAKANALRATDAGARCSFPAPTTPDTDENKKPRIAGLFIGVNPCTS